MAPSGEQVSLVENMTRVLVIDDDPDIRQLITIALSDEGYQVDEASDGRAALDLLAHTHPNIILLDMRMPGMDGWQFVQRYRELYGRRSPIIVVTAAHDPSRRGAEVDADSYLSKPFDIGDLIERVSALTKPGNPN
jgi:DNA-binding response OmpR family regulator